MTSAQEHRQAAEAALGEARRNPVLSVEQWFRTAQIHALLAIDGRLAQLLDVDVGVRPDLVGRS
jgi:hypothetical protein